MKIIDLSEVYTGVNTYICYDEYSLEGFIVDPGAPEHVIMKAVDDNKLVIKGILLTHGHFDHIESLAAVKKRLGCDVYAHTDESLLLGDAELNLSKSLWRKPIEVSADVLLNHMDEIVCGGIKITVIHIPGHTPGGVCYYLKDDGVMFSGDSLFRRSIGRADLPLGDEKLLKKSIIERLYALDDAITVYPGHSGKTTIGSEKKGNPFVRIAGAK